MTKVIAVDLPSGRHLEVDTLLDAIDLQVKHFLVEPLALGPSIIEELTDKDFALSNSNGIEPVFTKEDAEALVTAIQPFAMEISESIEEVLRLKIKDLR